MKSLLATPRVAWPTLLLLAGALAMWASGIELFITRKNRDFAH